MGEAQTAAHVLMIRPVRFAPNGQTAASNRFQHAADKLAADLQASALLEFEGLSRALQQAGIGVTAFDDTPEPHTPDSIFPNNWVSFHADGTVLLYPMLAPNRRLERRPELLEALRRQGFRIDRVIDFSHYEADQCYLEGTGSLVLDRLNRIAYACLSPRTSPRVLAEFARRLDYRVVAFDAADAAGIPIYHTNVMLSIGCRLAIVCTASIRADQRTGLLQSLQSSGRCILELNQEQMQAFAGNVLELCTHA